MILYSTEHCSLCEQALDWLFSMPELAGHALEVIDIAESDDLVASYGERLPVLRVGENEMDWPFDAEVLARMLND